MFSKVSQRVHRRSPFHWRGRGMWHLENVLNIVTLGMWIRGARAITLGEDVSILMNSCDILENHISVPVRRNAFYFCNKLQHRDNSW